MSDRRNWDLGPDARVRLGHNVAVRRLRAGLSRAEVGRPALVSDAWLRTAEEGRAGSSLDSWVRLAGALDVALDELIDGVTWVPAPPEAGDGGGGYILD
jgi:hypothetical protein